MPSLSDIYKKIDEKLGGYLPGGVPPKKQQQTPPPITPPSKSPTITKPIETPTTKPPTPAPSAPDTRGGGGGGGGGGRGSQNIVKEIIPPTKLPAVTSIDYGITPPNVVYITQAEYAKNILNSPDYQNLINKNLYVFMDQQGKTIGTTSAGQNIQSGIDISGKYKLGQQTGTGQQLLTQAIETAYGQTLVAGETKFTPVQDRSYRDFTTYVPRPTTGVETRGTGFYNPTTGQFETAQPQIGEYVPPSTFGEFVKSTPQAALTLLGGITKVPPLVRDITTEGWSRIVPDYSITSNFVPPADAQIGTGFYNPTTGQFEKTPTQISAVIPTQTGLNIIEQYPKTITTTISPSKIIGLGAELGTYAAGFAGAKALSLGLGGGALLAETIFAAPFISSGTSQFVGSFRPEEEILREANLQKYNLSNLPYGITLEDARKYNKEIEQYVKDVRRTERTTGVIEASVGALPFVTRGIGKFGDIAVKRESGLTQKELEQLAREVPGSLKYFQLMLKAKRNIEKAVIRDYGYLGSAEAERIALQRIKALDLAFPSTTIPAGVTRIPVSDFESVMGFPAPSPLITDGTIEITPALFTELSGRQSIYSEALLRFPSVFRKDIVYGPSTIIGSGTDLLQNNKIAAQIFGYGQKTISTTKEFKLPDIFQQTTLSARNVQFRRQPFDVFETVIYGKTESGGLIKIGTGKDLAKIEPSKIASIGLQPEKTLKRLKGFGLLPKIKEINLATSYKSGKLLRGFGVSAEISSRTNKLINKRITYTFGKTRKARIAIFKPSRGPAQVRRVRVEGMPDILVTRKRAVTFEELQTAVSKRSREKLISPNIKLREYLTRYSLMPTPKGFKGLGFAEADLLAFQKLKLNLPKTEGVVLGKELTRDILKYGKPSVSQILDVKSLRKGRFVGTDITLSTQLRRPYILKGLSIEQKTYTPFKYEPTIPTTRKPSKPIYEIKSPDIVKPKPSPAKPTPELKLDTKATLETPTAPRFEARILRVPRSEFYGKGTYELTSGGLAPGALKNIGKLGLGIGAGITAIPTITGGKITEGIKVTDLQRPLETQIIEPMQTLEPIEQIKVDTLTKVDTTQVVSPKTRTEVAQIQTPQLVITPRPAEVTRPQPPRPITRQPRPFIRPPTIFRLPDIKDNFAPKKKTRVQRRVTAFVPEVRRRGKFQALGRFETPEIAVAVGKAKVRGGLGATFRVRTPTGFLPVAPSEEFRFGKTPFALVQRRTERLRTAGEKAEFKLARRQKASSFWGFRI